MSLIHLTFTLLILCIGTVVAQIKFCDGQDAAVWVNISFPSKPFPHIWEKCVGSGRAYLGLREDWRRDLELSHRELGFKYVRFHDILDDDMNVVRVGSGGKLFYNFYQVFALYDWILSIGMKPLVELSFTPSQVASGTDTVFWYKAITSPPKSLPQWGEIITTFVQRLVDRYGLDEVVSWPFEVWNEPNCGFFAGDQVLFFKLYATVERAVHSVSPRLRVGGPVTCQNAWVAETLAMVANGSLKTDFIATHMYPTDFGANNVTVNIMRDRIAEVRKLVGNKFPLYYTEYNDGLYDPGYHDTPYAASFIAKNVVDLVGIVDLLSWWTFSDVFDEGGLWDAPFGKTDGWGLISLYHIRKPSFGAFQMLHWTGPRSIQTVVSGAGKAGTLGAVTTINATHVMMLLWNHDLPQKPPPTLSVCVQFAGFPASYQGTAVAYLIDETHTNPMAHWMKLGSPMWPTQDQIAELQDVGSLKGRVATYKRNRDLVQFTFELKPFSLLGLVLPLPGKV